MQGFEVRVVRFEALGLLGCSCGAFQGSYEYVPL